jgi:hypothetical protein
MWERDEDMGSVNAYICFAQERTLSELGQISFLFSLKG